MQLVLFSLFIVISLINSGAILDQRRWIFYLEYARMVLVILAIGLFYPNSWTISVLLAVVVLITWYFRPIKRYYFQLLYAGSGH